MEVKTTQVTRFDRSLSLTQLFLIQAILSHLESKLHRRLYIYIGGTTSENSYDDFT